MLTAKYTYNNKGNSPLQSMLHILLNVLRSGLLQSFPPFCSVSFKWPEKESFLEAERNLLQFDEGNSDLELSDEEDHRE